MCLAAQFHFDLFKFSLIQGVALGALYGILAIALVLTFRMSRVVGFVHGGIATASAFFYWYLVADPTLVSGQSVGGAAWNTHQWPKFPAVVTSWNLRPPSLRNIRLGTSVPRSGLPVAR